MTKRPIADRIRARIEQKRSDGKTAAEIGRYARSAIGQFNLSHDALGLTAEESRMTQPTLPEIVAKEKRLARRTEQRPSGPVLEPRKSLKGGIGPTKAAAVLGCTKTELDRWAADGRLPSDGERFFHGIGPLGGSKWGRAWLPETLEAALQNVDEWRRIDATRKSFRRSGLKAI